MARVLVLENPKRRGGAGFFDLSNRLEVCVTKPRPRESAPTVRISAPKLRFPGFDNNHVSENSWRTFTGTCFCHETIQPVGKGVRSWSAATLAEIWALMHHPPSQLSKN